MPLVRSALCEVHALRSSLWLVALWGLLASGLSLSTRSASRAYASQSAFVSEMLHRRPLDPSGYLYGAREAIVAHNLSAATHLLRAMPVDDLPLPHAHRAVDELLVIGDIGRAAAVAQGAIDRLGREPRLLMGLATARAWQGRWAESVTLFATAISVTSPEQTAICATLRRRLTELLARPDVPAAIAGRLRGLLASVIGMQGQTS